MREIGGRVKDPEIQNTGPRKLSHSSAGVLLGCERRYYHKIQGTPYDPDFDNNQKHFRIGKAFHLALELCKHVKEKFNMPLFQKAMKAEGVVDPQERGLIYAMCLNYLTLHKRSMLKVLECEIEVGDKHAIGYVDAVMADAGGNWWIVDLKTAAKIAQDLLSRLANDPQLNLYAFYAGDISKKLKLDLKKFQGTRYRVTTKVGLMIKPNESTIEYAKRIQGRVESYDVGIPFNETRVLATRHRLEVLFDRTQEIKDLKEQQVMQNFNNCFNYFSPCGHWSRCHGATYSSACDKLTIVDSKQIKPTTSGVTGGKILQDDDDDDAIFDLL